MSTKSYGSLPPRPRLVLRVGFAGRKELTGNEQKLLDAVLESVLHTIGRRLAAIASGIPVEQGKEPPVSAFYSRQCPLLRLVTGLCEGADFVAGEVLSKVNIPSDVNASCPVDSRCLETELAAVLPFDVVAYRCSRPSEYQPQFDRQLARCAWVLALDGIYDKPTPDTPLARNRRARAYRAQSAFLLRHSDVIIAAANPDDSDKAGGTLETVREALAFDLPVIFIHTGRNSVDEAVYLIEPEDNLPNALASTPPSAEILASRLHEWVTQITADPDNGLASGLPHETEATKHGESLLTEYFDQTDSPARVAEQCLIRLRKWTWTWFVSLFKSGSKPIPDPILPPYANYRDRSTTLNYHYSALYRGAFLLNYILAIVAVILAAASLTLLGTAGHTSLGGEIAILLEKAGHQAKEAAVSPTPQPWLLPLLLFLATWKLVILTFISRNTRIANRQKWNDRAVDTRYLAERLRGMYYLPEAGSQQPPMAAPPQFASRAVRQSTVDWLFDAIVRSISPADLTAAGPLDIPTHNELDTITVKKLLILHPLTVVEKVRTSWIKEQAQYHENNSRTMHAMHLRLEMVQKWLGWIVIGVVVLDLGLIGGKAFHWLPHALIPFAKTATPWLIATSAVLPAIVAALSGIRFQSECQRLAERSDVMRAILAGRPDAPGGRQTQADSLAHTIRNASDNPATNLGSWSHDALRLTERIATDFVQEAAEWSVLYAKEVSEPG